MLNTLLTGRRAPRGRRPLFYKGAHRAPKPVREDGPLVELQALFNEIRRDRAVGA